MQWVVHILSTCLSVLFISKQIPSPFFYGDHHRIANFYTNLCVDLQCPLNIKCYKQIKDNFVTDVTT